MKTMKCKSCGAKLKVEKGQEYVSCEYCGTEYKLDEDLKDNASFNIDEAKRKLGSMNDVAGQSAKAIGIAVLVSVSILFIIVIALFIIPSTGKKETDVDKFTSQQEVVDRSQEYDVYKFNLGFSAANGTKYGASVGYTLDDVISNNKEYPEKQIRVIYNEINTQDERAIIDIKHSLKDFSEYEVIINKDKEGFICEVIIEDIKK